MQKGLRRYRKVEHSVDLVSHSSVYHKTSEIQKTKEIKTYLQVLFMTNDEY